MLADQIGKLADGTLTEKSRVLNDISIIEFDNITEFSAYVAQIFEDASREYHEDENKKGSALSYMREQFYSANNSVNDILKVYFPEQFGERHFLAYPIGHFFVAVTNMWDSENGGIKIENMNDIAECLYSGALHEKIPGSLITTFNLTKNYFSSKTVKVLDNSVFGFKELAGCKIFLKEHQLKTTMRCLQEKKCRVMLADEVGMGKTIEAASVLKVYLLHNSNKKILIAVPHPLVAQWRTELLIKFEIIPGQNINDNYVQLIAEEDIENHINTRWDFVIADEAHKLLANRRLRKLPKREKKWIMLLIKSKWVHPGSLSKTI